MRSRSPGPYSLERNISQLNNEVQTARVNYENAKKPLITPPPPPPTGGKPETPRERRKRMSQALQRAADLLSAYEPCAKQRKSRPGNLAALLFSGL